MPVQYLYPSGESVAGSFNSLISQSTFTPNYISTYWSKSESSSSGYYSYVDEGVSTYNDLDYLYSSGLISNGVINLSNRNYITFNTPALQVIPSSIDLNIRATYTPGVYSGEMVCTAYLHSSGGLFNYTTAGYTAYLTGFNTESVLASSIFTVTSGVNFTSLNVPLKTNRVGIDTTDRYDLSFITLGYNFVGVGYEGQDNGLFKISALEIVASGELYCNHDNHAVSLQMPGDNLQLNSDRLLIYNNLNTQFFNIEATDEFSNITQTNNQNWDASSPQMCLNSGNFDRENIFRDCFFEFNQKPGSKNNINFISSKSSHTFNLNSVLSLGASGNVYVGQGYSTYDTAGGASAGAFEDSYINFEPDLIGVVSGVLPSGDFSLWIGASQLPYNVTEDVWFVKDFDFDFRFGVDSNQYLSTSLLKNDGSRVTVKSTLANQQDSLGAIVSYSGGVLSLYKMNRDGHIEFMNGSTQFTRYPKSQPSGDIKFSLPTSVNNIDLNLYEFGVVGSGLSNVDLPKLERQRLFQTTHQHTYTQPMLSGYHHIEYKSLEDRNNFGIGYYSGIDYNYGNGLNGLYPLGQIFDASFTNSYVSGKYYAPYTDIAINCHLSGNNSNFYQDGDLYFSGWIDVSTTNPSGLLNNNFFVRILQDRSTQYDITDFTYTSSPSSDTPLPPMFETIFTDSISARGKAAACITSLHSGLNEYIVPMDKVMYFYDRYYNSTNNSAGSVIYGYDKTFEKHPDWNGADVSLYYIGNKDQYNSGYIDTVKIYTAAIICDDWVTPPTGVNNQLNLYTRGIGATYSGCDLYLNANYESGCVDLFLHSDTWNQYSGASPVNLVCWLNSGEINSSINLSMVGHSGAYGYFAEIPLFTFAEPTPTMSGSLNLFTNSTTNTSITDNLNLMTVSRGRSDWISLFLKGEDSGSKIRIIPLVVFNDNSAFGALDLVVVNNTSSIFSPQKLFIQGYGQNEGASVYRGGHTLYIGSGGGEESYYNSVQLTLAGPSGSVGGVNMFIEGGTYVSSDLDLVMASSVGVINDNTTLYTFGF